VGSVDTKKLTCEVAARHGLLIRDDDPVMALVTMSEIVFGAGLGKGRSACVASSPKQNEGRKKFNKKGYCGSETR
jgi:hypothetical protein